MRHFEAGPGDVGASSSGDAFVVVVAAPAPDNEENEGENDTDDNDGGVVTHLLRRQDLVQLLVCV